MFQETMEVIRFGELHPLENPVVLDSILKELSFKDLQNVRLVSKSLRKNTSKLWRSSVILKIDSNATSNDTGRVSMTEFLEFVEKDSDEYLKSPFTNVVLHEQSQRFWNLCGSSIKHLEIYNYNILDNSDDPINFEKEYRPTEEDTDCLGSPSLTFLKHAKALEKLVLANGCSQAIKQTDLSKMTNFELDKCVELTIYDDYVLPVDDLRKLMSWLPRVKILKMSLDNDTFSLVCEQWMNLKSLDVIGIGLDDIGITGLSENAVRTINKERESGVLMTSLTRRPNITCLKHLESIMVIGVDDCHSLFRPFFDHCAAICGFLQLKDVKIQFRNCLLEDRYLWQYGTSCNQINRAHFLYGSKGFAMRHICAHLGSFSLSQQEKYQFMEKINRAHEVQSAQP